VRHPRGREFILLIAATGVFAIGYAQLGSDVAIPFLGFACAFAAIHFGTRAWAPRADPVIVPVAAFLVAVGAMQLASIDRLQKDVR
jgi:hypothetical protein